jgi:hypothetical protein
VAFAATAVVLGLAPAEIISPRFQNWTATILLHVAALLLSLWILLRLRLLRSLQFSLSGMLGVVGLSGLLFASLAMAWPWRDLGIRLPFDIAMTPRGWEGWDPRALERALQPLGRWFWALLQWMQHGGPWVAIALWAAAIAVFVVARHRPATRNNGAQASRRELLAACIRELGQPALRFAVLAMLVGLTLGTLVADPIEQEYQRNMAAARQPSAEWIELDVSLGLIRADQGRMTSLAAAVQADRKNARTPSSPATPQADPSQADPPQDDDR